MKSGYRGVGDQLPLKMLFCQNRFVTRLSVTKFWPVVLTRFVGHGFNFKSRSSKSKSSLSIWRSPKKVFHFDLKVRSGP